jgi:hypothetical protein
LSRWPSSRLFDRPFGQHVFLTTDREARQTLSRFHQSPPPADEPERSAGAHHSSCGDGLDLPSEERERREPMAICGGPTRPSAKRLRSRVRPKNRQSPSCWIGTRCLVNSSSSIRYTSGIHFLAAPKSFASRRVNLYIPCNAAPHELYDQCDVSAEFTQSFQRRQKLSSLLSSHPIRVWEHECEGSRLFHGGSGRAVVPCAWRRRKLTRRFLSFRSLAGLVYYCSNPSSLRVWRQSQPLRIHGESIHAGNSCQARIEMSPCLTD